MDSPRLIQDWKSLLFILEAPWEIRYPSFSPREKFPGDVSENVQGVGTPCIEASVPTDVTECAWVTRTPAGGVPVLWLQQTNSHGLQKPCGGKGMAWPLSKWERGPWPLPGQAFIAFLGTLHRGWSSFTMHRFAVGDYLLQITKERILLITTKRRMLKMWLNWLHSILGRFSTDFRKPF